MRSLIKTRETSPLPDPGMISALDVASARRIAADIFKPYGLSVPGYIIRSDSNKKLSLEVPGYQGIAGLTLTPATHGPATSCVFFRHCKDLCVLTHGRGAFESVIKARSARVSLLMEAPEAASVLLAHDIDRYSRAWDRWGLRLNVASDLAWEIAAPWLIDRARLGGASIYDYSKRWDRDPDPLPGYRLTFSAAGHSIEEITGKVSTGANVAIVLPIEKGYPLPDRWHDLEVIDGDLHDLRALDPRGVIVGLRAKGKAIHSIGSKLLYEVAS
jgi:hypothetical protein